MRLVEEKAWFSSCKEGLNCLANRQVRDPYAWWCERAGVTNLGHSSLLDSLLAFLFISFHFVSFAIALANVNTHHSAKALIKQSFKSV